MSSWRSREDGHSPLIISECTTCSTSKQTGYSCRRHHSCKVRTGSWWDNLHKRNNIGKQKIGKAPTEHYLNTTAIWVLFSVHIQPFILYPLSPQCTHLLMSASSRITQNVTNHFKLVSWRWWWVYWTQMASTATSSNSVLAKYLTKWLVSACEILVRCLIHPLEDAWTPWLSI